MEFFVALAHAADHLDGFFFVGSRDLYGLEAAFEGAILFDGLAIFAGSRGADALNFAAGQRGLQDVGGVQRAFGGTRAHKSVQLVDEHDRVLALHQFLHDGLEPLFELAAIFCAGNNQGKIERKDALVRKERRNVAVGDALREPFYDGGLADAGFADQHGIIFRAAAENLDHALDFAFASDQRIERAFGSGLREVAAEFGEQRSFFRSRGGGLFAGRAREFFAQRGEPQAALHQNLGAETLFFAQDSEQQVLGADVLDAETLGFFAGHIEDALALRAERHFHRSRNALANRDAGFDLFADGFDRSLLPQEAIGQRFVLAHQAEQQMLGLDVRAAVLAGFVSRKENNASRFFCIPFEHD